MVRKVKESITTGSKNFPFYNTTNANGDFSGVCPMCGCGAVMNMHKARINSDVIVIPCECAMCGTTFNNKFEYTDTVVDKKGNVDVNDKAYQYRLSRLGR